MVKIDRNITISVKPTAAELADCFCEMYADDQARFFNNIADLVKEWSAQFVFQLQSMNNSGILTKGGKEVMRVIGSYGEED